MERSGAVRLHFLLVIVIYVVSLFTENNDESFLKLLKFCPIGIIVHFF